MADIEKTACRHAWTYPIIDMGRAELRNCCRTPFNTISDDDWSMGINIFKNLEAIKKVKRELLMGIKSEKCRTCWTSEDYGIQSARSGLDDFAHFVKAVKWHQLTHDQIKEKLRNLTNDEIEELVNLEHPEHVELSLSTTCDLKCVYCSHVFSTQWATERLKYGEITPDQVPKNNSDEYEQIWWEWFEKVASKTVHKITFVGGEPLINDKFYYYVDRLIEYYEQNKTNKLHIFIATNLNTPKKFFEKFKTTLQKIVNSKYVSIGIGLSFESVGDKNSVIRANANWEVFNKNVFNLMDAIKTYDVKKNKSNIVIMPSLNSLSISNLPEFLKYIISMRDNFDRFIRISNTHVTYPMRYSPFILTSDFSSYIDQSIEILKSSKWYEEIEGPNHGSWIIFADYLSSIKNSINTSNNDEVKFARKDFAQDINKLSVRRNFNFAKVFPEMVDFFKFCSEQ